MCLVSLGRVRCNALVLSPVNYEKEKVNEFMSDLTIPSRGKKCKPPLRPLPFAQHAHQDLSRPSTVNKVQRELVGV
jgi:hypothetical protein